MTIVVNGRFTTRPVTGVERYAHSLVDALRRRGEDVRVLRPPSRVLGRGAAGHLWEQAVLPSMVPDGHGPLLSLCNFGPVRLREQVVVLHDVAPFLLPEAYGRGYVAAARLLQPRLARSCRVATVSRRARDDLARTFSLDPADIHVVPPAVGAPFAPADVEHGRYCVFVGGHDPRKNLELLLRIWPTVRRQLGLELLVVGRRRSSTLRDAAAAEVDGTRWVRDADDHDLARLYRGALCVLSPSRYEGFGLPLLEAMACGTPFLATDTGAARELAPDPERQLLPPEPDQWLKRLRDWCTSDLDDLRRAGLAAAAERTWERSAVALLDLVDGGRQEVAAP